MRKLEDNGLVLEVGKVGGARGGPAGVTDGAPDWRMRKNGCGAI